MPNGGLIYRRIAIGGFVVILIIVVFLVGNWKQFLCRPGVIFSWPIGLLQKDCPHGQSIPPWIYFLYGVGHTKSATETQSLVNQLTTKATTADNLLHNDSRFGQCCCSYSADKSNNLAFNFNGIAPPDPNAYVAYNGNGLLPNPGNCPSNFKPDTLDVLQTNRGIQLNQATSIGNAQFTFFRPDGNTVTVTTGQGGFFQFTLTTYDSDVSTGNSGGALELLLFDPADPTTVIVISQGAIVVPLSS